MKAQCRLYRRNYHNFKSNKYATLTANLILVNEKDKEMRKLQVWPLFATVFSIVLGVIAKALARKK